MERSPVLSNLLLPVAVSRYKMITTGKFHFLGALTLYIGQPICFLIGAALSLGDSNARASS